MNFIEYCFGVLKEILKETIEESRRKLQVPDMNDIEPKSLIATELFLDSIINSTELTNNRKLNGQIIKPIQRNKRMTDFFKLWFEKPYSIYYTDRKEICKKYFFAE